MARWEYCRISWAGHVGAPEVLAGAAGEHSGRASEGVDSRQLRSQHGLLEQLGRGAAAERITQLDDTIARLERAGWELVSHMQLYDKVPVQQWYFKRELRDVLRTDF